MSAIYPWEVLEESLRSHFTRGKYRDMHGVAMSPEVLARALLVDIEDADWQLVKNPHIDVVVHRRCG